MWWKDSNVLSLYVHRYVTCNYTINPYPAIFFVRKILSAFYICCIYSSFVLFGLVLYIPVNSYVHVWTVSSPNHTFFWASLTKRLTSTLCTYFCLYLTTTLLESAEGRRMAVEIISWSISAKVWDRAGIKLATPGSAFRHVSAVRHVTDCATRPSAYIQVHFRLHFSWKLPRIYTIYYRLCKNLSRQEEQKAKVVTCRLRVNL